MDFAIKYMTSELKPIGGPRERRIDLETAKKFTCTSGLFYGVLVAKPLEVVVKEHWAGPSFFESEHALFPIKKDCHWALVDFANLNYLEKYLEASTKRLNFKKPCIYYMCSLRKNSVDDELIAKLQKYVCALWFARKCDGSPTKEYAAAVKAFVKKELMVYSVRVPLQLNFKDCGLFCLENMQELLLGRLISKFNRNIYSQDDMVLKRQALSDLINSLVKESKSEVTLPEAPSAVTTAAGASIGAAGANGTAEEAPAAEALRPSCIG